MSRRKTWRDWLIEDGVDPVEVDAIDPATLLTRDEVIERVNRHVGIERAIDVDDLETWEYRGFLPQPIRRRHRGATRALYPAWMVNVVLTLRLHQQMGTPLGEIGAVIRPDYASILSEEDRHTLKQRIARRQFDRKIDKMRRQLDELVRAFEAETGTEIGPVDITIHAVRT